MNWSDLSDLNAVHEAIREFDQIGHSAFLKKYGYRRAKEYFLEQHGRRYDSKAILGAAFGYQYPEHGPLKASEFSGGEDTVKSKLEELGFVVSRIPEARKEKRYWALCANPAIYNIDDAVRTLLEDWWGTGGKNIQRGDEVAIWRSRGKDGNRGIVALGLVLTDAENRADTENRLWKKTVKAEQVMPRVCIRYFVPQKFPVWANTDKGAFLRDFAVSKARGGTIFEIPKEQWAALTAFCGNTPASSEVAELESVIRPGLKRRSTGQGFGLSAEQRKAVEIRAMKVAIEHYSKHWQTVEDVSMNASCDLICVNGACEQRVEVKGTTGGAASVFLTKNEVELARRFSPHTALFVVSEITLRQEGDQWIAEGGQHTEITPWNAPEENLEAIAYQFWLNRTPRL